MPRIDLLKIYASRFPPGRDRLRKTPLHRLKPAETSFKDRTSTSKENTPQKPKHGWRRRLPCQTPQTEGGPRPSAPGPLACPNQEHPVCFRLSPVGEECSEV